jgi:hypothetical protein
MEMQNVFRDGAVSTERRHLAISLWPHLWFGSHRAFLQMQIGGLWRSERRDGLSTKVKRVNKTPGPGRRDDVEDTFTHSLTHSLNHPLTKTTKAITLPIILQVRRHITYQSHTYHTIHLSTRTMDQYHNMAGDYSWLDPALHSQTIDNMHAANDARVPAPYPCNMNAAHHVTIPLPGPDNTEPTHHASIPTTASYNMEPINQASAPPPGLNKMETANEDKALPPDYSQVFDPAKLSELWAVSP